MKHLFDKFMGHIHEPEAMVPHEVLTSMKPKEEAPSMQKKREEAIAWLRSKSLYVLDRDSPPPQKSTSVLGQHRDRTPENNH